MRWENNTTNSQAGVFLDPRSGLVYFNINDPDNLGTGDINCWVVEGNVGAVDTFTRNGGAGIRARRIGSADSHAH